MEKTEHSKWWHLFISQKISLLSLEGTEKKKRKSNWGPRNWSQRVPDTKQNSWLLNQCNVISYVNKNFSGNARAQCVSQCAAVHGEYSRYLNIWNIFEYFYKSNHSYTLLGFLVFVYFLFSYHRQFGSSSFRFTLTTCFNFILSVHKF